jgi:hypothetical protein
MLEEGDMYTKALHFLYTSPLAEVCMCYELFSEELFRPLLHRHAKKALTRGGKEKKIREKK